MSTLKVNKLRDTTGSADAITLDPNGGAVLAGVTTVTSVKVGAAVTISESGIEASGIGITCANINGTQIGGRKNLIINGAMQIAQRATSYTGGGYETVDRFFVDLAGLDENPTQAQVDVSSGTTPYTLGFRKAYKITNGNQTSGANAGDVIYIKQKIESRNVSNSGWNYTSASSFVTLQFWIKSSVAQTFTCHLSTEDGTSYIYNFDTGSLAANTWTKIVKTIPGNSNLEIGNDNGNGLAVVVNAFAGTNFTDSSTTYDTWTTYSTGIFGGKDNTSTWFTTNDATLEVTGFQLEVGPQATAFEHRSFGEELSLCQRYCQVFEGPSNSQGGDSQTALCENCSLYQANNLFMSIPTKVSMRAKPSMSVATGTQYYVAYSNGGGVDLDGTNLNMNGNTGTEFFVINHTVTSLGTSGHSALFRMSNSSAKVTFSAEL